MDNDEDTNVQRPNGDSSADGDDYNAGDVGIQKLYNAMYRKRYLVEVSLRPEHNVGPDEDWPEGVIPI